MRKYAKTYIALCLLLLGLACVLFAEDIVVLTRQTDTRKNVDYPVWDALVTASWDADDANDVTQAITLNGIIQKIVLVAPNCENAVTFQVVIKDNEGSTIFDSGEQNEDATYSWSVHEPMTGTWSVVIGPNAVLGDPHPDLTLTLRGI